MIVSVGIYRREHRFIVETWSLKSSGLGVFDGFEILPDTATASELGEAVLRRRDAAREGLPLEPWAEGESPFSEMLAAVGVKSWRQFARSASHCSVDFLSDEVANAIPSYRDGAGFSGDREGIVECAVEAGTIGETVMVMLVDEG